MTASGGPKHEALRMAVMWHGVAFLPCLRAMDRAALQQACTQASDLSGAHVLHMPPDVATRAFEISALARARPGSPALSGAQVIAVMVFGLWVLCDEREELCTGLVEAWPIRDALVLAPTPPRGIGEADRITPMTWQRLMELVERASKVTACSPGLAS